MQWLGTANRRGCCALTKADADWTRAAPRSFISLSALRLHTLTSPDHHRCCQYDIKHCDIANGVQTSSLPDIHHNITACIMSDFSFSDDQELQKLNAQVVSALNSTLLDFSVLTDLLR
jgi:hypothetical protein